MSSGKLDPMHTVKVRGSCSKGPKIMRTLSALIIILAIAGVAYLLYARWVSITRIKSIRQKYSDESIANALTDQKIWIGMTTEQLIDSWGSPKRIREYSSISDVIYEYKYTKLGRNQFPARVTVANKIVTDWTASSKPTFFQRLGIAPDKRRQPLA
jgi:hypothetical protein